LAEKIGKTGATIVYTDVELTMGVAPFDESDSSEPSEKEYVFSVAQSDVDGETLTEDDYLLEVNFDGTVALTLRKGSEGVAEALRHEDPLFMAARQWHAATPYDATSLAKELDRLQELKLEESGEVV
jgi:hypothetical protein